jgi:predicted O-linked N-acetylglucosamine transferase (SPINDLY family)
MPEIGPLPARENGYITFGSFSRVIRFNDRVLRCWAELLQAVPGSRLVLNTHHFKHETHCRQFQEKFAGWGVAPERLTLYSTFRPQTWDEYQKIDIALDPFPHNAGTTTLDALWMGAPVLSMAGTVSMQRLGAAILRPLGLDRWVVDSPEQYVERGAELAGDIDALEELRGQLRTRMRESAFMDYEGFTRAVEDAYEDMFNRFMSSSNS